MENLDIHVFRSLTKKVTWGGIPRNIFILIVVASLISIILFQSIKGILPILTLYLIILFLCKYDQRVFTILWRNLGKRTHYFSD